MTKENRLSIEESHSKQKLLRNKERLVEGDSLSQVWDNFQLNP